MSLPKIAGFLAALCVPLVGCRGAKQGAGDPCDTIQLSVTRTGPDSGRLDVTIPNPNAGANPCMPKPGPLAPASPSGD